MNAPSLIEFVGNQQTNYFTICSANILSPFDLAPQSSKWCSPLVLCEVENDITFITWMYVHWPAIAQSL
jgi:hypothetical protein